MSSLMCHLMVFSKGVTECVQVCRLVRDSFAESSDAKCIIPICCDKYVILVKYIPLILIVFYGEGGEI